MLSSTISLEPSLGRDEPSVSVTTEKRIEIEFLSRDTDAPTRSTRTMPQQRAIDHDQGADIGRRDWGLGVDCSPPPCSLRGSTMKRREPSTIHVRTESSASSNFDREFWTRFRIVVVAGFLVGVPSGRSGGTWSGASCTAMRGSALTVIVTMRQS